MIKRIIACLTICLIITGLINPVFSDASALPQPNWTDPGISEIINISDLTGWMLNGGTFDVSTYTDAESFMNDYFNARTKTRLVSPSEATEDYYEVLPGFGIHNQFVAGDSFARPLDTNRVIASSFRDHTGYGRRFSEEVNKSLLNSGNLSGIHIPLLNDIEFANFVNYDHDALRLYSEFFNTDSNVPNPDPEFIPLLSQMGDFKNTSYSDTNGHFFIADESINSWIEKRSGIYVNFPNRKNHSYVACGSNGYYSSTDATFSSGSQKSFWVTDSILNIYLNSDGNGGYDATFNGLAYAHNIIPNNNSWNRFASMYWSFYNWFVFYNIGDEESIYPTPTARQTHFDGLSIAINHIFNYYRNINLYVDNVPWVLTDNFTPPPSITPEFPDAVGGEDLPSTTWPISRPQAPYYTSVPGMLQAIEDAIQGDGKLDIDDLKPYLTDENGDPVPDPIFDPEPVPIPVPDTVNPDVVPGLPVLPAMPPEMPGFSGVSVLAEIINFTNQSLPTSLIVTFWGIVFGIVILGLIKILHK